MAKTKNAELVGSDAISEPTPKGMVRLYRTTIVGGYIDVDPDHAERILAFEKAMGASNYEKRESDQTKDSGSNKESEE